MKHPREQHKTMIHPSNNERTVTRRTQRFVETSGYHEMTKRQTLSSTLRIMQA